MDGQKKLLKFALSGTMLLSGPISPAQIEDDEDYQSALNPPAEAAPVEVNPSKPGANGKNASEGPLSGKKKEEMAKAGIEDITSARFNETIESFDFPNADVADVVKAISELTGKNFIIDSQVRGKITIIAPTRITVAEAYKAFLSALAINGMAVVPSGGFYKIRPKTSALKDGVDTYSGSYYPSADQLITRIFHLKYISAETVNRDLKPMFQSVGGEVNVYTGTNSLIVSDYGANIDRIQRIINSLDVPGFEEQLEVMPVKYAKAKDIAELVNKIVNKGDTRNQNGGGFVAGMPRPATSGSRGSQGGAYFLVIPDDRTNALIVSGNKAGIERIRKLLKQLDFRMNPEETGGFYVYNVRYGEAEKIAQTLQGVIKDATPKPSSNQGYNAPMISPVSGIQQPTQEIFGGDVKVQADKATNSLVIIVSSKQDYETMKSLLAQLDIPRDQVFVEAVIMEMQSSDSFSWKVGGFQFQGNNGVKTGFNTFEGNTLGDLLNPASGQGAIIPFGGGSSVDITPPNGTKVTVPSLMGFINFLKTNGNANVLSTPQILALDNQEAFIEVGDKIVTGSTLQTTQYGSTETQTTDDATIKMKLTPSISSQANSVRLTIDASVKQLSTAPTPSALRAKTQPIATRAVKTNIIVPNQATAVLGGLMKDEDLEEISKVPLLGDIPLLGWLFKSRSTRRVKTNMLIFLTPRIIRSPSENQKLLGEKIDERLKYVKKAGGLDPYGETMDALQKKNNLYSKSAPAGEASGAKDEKADVPLDGLDTKKKE